MRFANGWPGAPSDDISVRRWRTLFLSDLHLGSRACQSAAIAAFLRRNDAETIYLVGDIVDGWRLKADWYWPPQHNEVFLTFADAARRGVRVIYVPGNHDDFLRDLYGSHFAGIEVRDTDIHEAADGKRYFVVHGDVCDPIVKRTRRLHVVGYRANRTITVLDNGINHVRRRFGLPYRSMSQWAKLRVKTSLGYLSDFEQAVTRLARELEQDVDGVICGHVHHAAISDTHGIRYVNCGDWVESCTAIAERSDGRMEILQWRADASVARSAPLTRAQAA